MNTSVTRFCAILPMWQNIKRLRQYFMVPLVFDKIWNLLLQNIFLLGKFHCCKWLNIEQTILASGHTEIHCQNITVGYNYCNSNPIRRWS